VTDLAERFADWLKAHPTFGGGLATFEPLAGGQSSTLFRFTTTGNASAFIVRVEPRGHQIFFTPDIVREFRIAEGLAKAGVPTAPLYAFETDEAVLAAPFMVMGEVAGRAPLGRPSMHMSGLLTELDASERARMSQNAIDVLAQIHGVEWRTTHPFLATRGGGLDHHLDHLTRWYRWTVQGRPFPVCDAALAQLHATRADLADTPDVLLWGDARPGNILFAHDQSVAAVLDLEAALVGPRGLDLGYWIMMDRFHSDAVAVPRLVGWPDDEATIACYSAASRIAVPDLDYFVLMGAFFMATTIIRAADLGIAAGKFATDTRFGHDNTATQIIADQLGLPIPPLSDDFAAHRGLPPGSKGLAV
jgi:aminoglycoside phosphotransferase (APT) family kinase protein